MEILACKDKLLTQYTASLVLEFGILHLPLILTLSSIRICPLTIVLSLVNMVLFIQSAPK